MNERRLTACVASECLDKPGTIFFDPREVP